MTLLHQDDITPLRTTLLRSGDKGGRGREIWRMIIGTVTFLLTGVEDGTQRSELDRGGAWTADRAVEEALLP